MKKSNMIILCFSLFSIFSANCLTDIQTKLLDYVRLNERTSKIKAMIKMSNIDVNFSDEEDGDTLLHLAARNGNLELVKFLIESRADVGARNFREDALLEEIKTFLDSTENSQRCFGSKKEALREVFEKIADVLISEGAHFALNLLIKALS